MKKPKVPLHQLVEALEIVGDEFSYQILRLEEIVKPRTDSEREYHENLKRGYNDARYWTGILRRYHQGRLARQQSGESTVPDIDFGVGPFVDEEF